MSLTIVKIGGSFCRYPRLRELAETLGKSGGRVVVVPGGGPFADRVRAEQARLRFGDAAAHRMAILAMAQFGHALADLSVRLTAAASVAAVREALAAGRTTVWLPLDLLDGRAEIPETWDMTSDSLAAWLAAQLQAERLIYLKRRAHGRPAALAALVAAGMLDPLAPGFIAASRAEAWLCGPRDLPRLAEALAAGRPIGRRIALA